MQERLQIAAALRRNQRIEIQTQACQIVHQHYGADDRWIRYRIVGRWHVVHVGEGNDLFFRQVHHQHVFGMRQALDVM